MAERYFEDFVVGQTFGSGTVTVTAERIKSFAAEYDPQPSSRSRPELGIVKTRVTTRNQDGVVVQVSRPVLMVRRR